MKLNVILRTCDKVSLINDRIVPKDECVIRCVKSLVNSLKQLQKLPYKLTIIDDRSSTDTRTKLKTIAPDAKFIWLDERDETGLNNRQKSRYSVKIAYDEIYKLPNNELVYIVEDDYLHYPDSIEKMIEAHEYFSSFISNTNIGIFPQDFNQLYPHPQNKFNDTYVRQCYVIPGPDRYYRSTWFTHESFLVPVATIQKYKRHFDLLLTIGDNDANWEGNTISKVWKSHDMLMLMPLKTFAIHVSKKEDISFFNTDFEHLWKQNEYS